MPHSRQRLVILGNSVTALAVARDAHRLGMDAVLADRERGIAFDTRCARSVLLSGGATEVAALGAAGRNSCLIATSDAWCQFLLANRPALQHGFMGILQASDAVLATCLDKAAFGGWCARHGIPSPQSGQDWGRLRLPLILRPGRTLHDEPHLQLPKAVEVASQQELDEWRQRFEAAGVAPVLTESLLGRRLAQFSVPVARSGGTMLSFVARKVRPIPERCRAGTYVVACAAPAVERLARRVAEALGFEGIGEVEILRDEDTGEAFVIEMNPRPWSQYALARALGLDYLAFVLGGRPAPPRPRERTAAWLDFASDLHVVLSRKEGMLRHGQVGWMRYLWSLLAAGASATFDLRDPQPFLAELRLLLGQSFARAE